MPIQMKMPRLSDTMEQGTIVKWNVKAGQKVAAGDVIADIETDKATMELQTFDDGVVASLDIPEGQQVPVGTVIMTLTGADEPAASKGAPSPSSGSAAPAPAKAAASSASGTAATVAAPAETAPTHAASNGHHASTTPGERIFASPLAKKIAGESGVDLAALTGTGPSGRIVRKDVEAALSSGVPVGRAAAPASREPAKISNLSAGAVPGVAMPPTAPMLAAKKVALSNMRQTIAKRLVQSKATIPHYQVTVTARMDALLTLRAQLNDQLASQGVKLSVNDFIVRACALAMHQHPFVNARWSEAQGAQPSIDILADVNIGVAIALPVDPATLSGGGLVVATLRNADRMGLRQISADTKRFSEKARAKGLTIDEMSDSTFTISNLGMFGVEHFTAIINPPNSAILAVGAAVEKPVVGKDPKTGEKKLIIGTEMQMTMSSDHRIIDGAMAAAYLATVKDFLEKPATLLV